MEIQVSHDDPAVKVSGLAVSSLGFWADVGYGETLPYLKLLRCSLMRVFLEFRLTLLP